MRQADRQLDLFDQAYLAAEPWGPAPGIVVGRDRFVVTKTDHVCFQCGFPIGAGARVRARAEIDRISHQAVTFYFCVECCRRMVGSEMRRAG